MDKWTFPIRMESKRDITIVPNIAECISRFKKPVDQLAWEHLLRTKRIAAKLPEDQPKLDRWWAEGWQNITPLPQQHSAPIPVLRLRNTMTGWDMDLVYPNLRSAAEGEQIAYKSFMHLTSELLKPHSERKFILLRQHNNSNILLLEDNFYKWTLFAADNTVLGHYPSKRELASAMRTSIRSLDTAHTNHWNRLPDGKWFWSMDWGFVPISPDDEPIGRNWRDRTKIGNTDL